jgi:hypothetical protein
MRREWKLAMVRHVVRSADRRICRADLTDAIDKITQVLCAVAHDVVEVCPEMKSRTILL